MWTADNILKESVTSVFLRPFPFGNTAEIREQSFNCSSQKKQWPSSFFLLFLLFKKNILLFTLYRKLAFLMYGSLSVSMYVVFCDRPPGQQARNSSILPVVLRAGPAWSPPFPACFRRPWHSSSPQFVWRGIIRTFQTVFEHRAWEFHSNFACIRFNLVSNFL